MKRNPILFFFIIIIGLFMLLFAVAVFFSVANFSDAFDREPVAIVSIEGPIFESIDILKELKELEEEKHVKAVVVRLDSPGGAVAPSQEIYEQLLELKKKKKVIVSMGTVAASGAYYIACAADKIVASSGSVTGSIGVIMESFGLQELIKKVEIEPRIIKSGQYKDVGTPFRDMTEEERSYLQNLIDNMYEQFVGAVSQNRNIPIEKMRGLAEGKVYTGLQAKEAGLVDELGNIYRAIDIARIEAGLSDDAKVRWPKEPSPIEKFFSGEADSLVLQQFMKKITGMYLPLWYMSSKQMPELTIQ